jgi:dTMP kinase
VRKPFIVIEGLDGSGGTTQSRLLTDWLTRSGHKVLLTREPSSGPVGKLIRKSLSGSSESAKMSDAVLPYLFAADRRDHLDQEIIPSLEKDQIVISDRYYHSSLAYQSLSIGLPRVTELNASFLRPDITFFLWLSPEVSFERVQLRGLPVERFETLDRLRAVAESYKSVIAHCKAMGEKIVKIDASRSIEEIHSDICQSVVELLDRKI